MRERVKGNNPSTLGRERGGKRESDERSESGKGRKRERER